MATSTIKQPGNGGHLHGWPSGPAHRRTTRMDASSSSKKETVLTAADIMVPPPQEDKLVNPMDWYRSPGPFEIEIGSGKGGFLLSRAKSRPDVRLLGMEWANKYYRYSADRMARRGRANVRVMRTDAKQFLMRHLPPACVMALYVFHPDPWPKKRHHKRRLFDSAFLDAVVRVLAPQGRLLLQTDHQEYFGEIVKLLEDQPTLSPLGKTAADLITDSPWAGTNFEIKYRREGRPIYRMSYVRTEP